MIDRTGWSFRISFVALLWRAFVDLRYPSQRWRFLFGASCIVFPLSERRVAWPGFSFWATTEMDLRQKFKQHHTSSPTNVHSQIFFLLMTASASCKLFSHPFFCISSPPCPKQRTSSHSPIYISKTPPTSPCSSTRPLTHEPSTPFPPPAPLPTSAPFSHSPLNHPKNRPTLPSSTTPASLTA